MDINSETATNCKRCLKRAPNGVKCIKCGRVSHPSCLKAVKNVKFHEDNLITCCEDFSNVGEATISTDNI